MAKKQTVTAFVGKSTSKRPGVHSKSKTSSIKKSKNYKKKYRGQG
jgi:hypothetical protein